ncbi:MAG: hypothetical protein ACYSRR_05255 [Planctomycetota bacterium]|jgi:hypothetical protein
MMKIESPRPAIRPSFLVAIAFSLGTIMFGTVAVMAAVAGNWITSLIVGLIAVFHCTSAWFYGRRYLLGKRRIKKLAKEVDYG